MRDTVNIHFLLMITGSAALYYSMYGLWILR